jgi:hypothetical protein
MVFEGFLGCECLLSQLSLNFVCAPICRDATAGTLSVRPAQRPSDFLEDSTSGLGHPL